jgi:cell division protein FtsW
MQKKTLLEILPPVGLLIVPALALGGVGLLVVAAAGSGSGTAGMGASSHFAIRQAIGLALGAALGGLVVRLGSQRVLGLAPALYAAALAVTLLVFVPGVGVHAAGASRWLRIGPFSANPAPLLIAAIGLVMAAWSRRISAARLQNRSSAMTLALIGVVVLAAEPDFSAAAIALLVAFAALAGGGVTSRRLLPAAVILLVALILGASRFGYVGGRIDGFLSPESDRRGKGFEVLALARTNANATAQGVGLGQGRARRRLSSPGSDYVYAVVSEELGRRGSWGVPAAWITIAAGVAWAARAARFDPRRRAAALGCGAAMLAPALLHIAVCRGWVPIIGVTMPLASYDPALTVVTGGEIGLLVAVGREREETEA